MKNYINKLIPVVCLLFLVVGCTVEEFGNPNAPDLDEIVLSEGDNLQETVVGMLNEGRGQIGPYLDNVSTLGREYYRLRSSDPRNTTELLGKGEEVLLGGSFYANAYYSAGYRAVKLSNIIIDQMPNDPIFTTQETEATLGFVKTMKAYYMLLNLNLTYQNGIRVDVSDPFNLGPFLNYTDALDALQIMLTEAYTHLGNGGTAFPFSPGSGFSNFDTPATFREVNKAIAARVALYQDDMSSVLNNLNDSFLDLNGDFDLGVVYNFANAANETRNPLYIPNTSGEVRAAHNSYAADIEAGDTRINKVENIATITDDGLSSDYNIAFIDSFESPLTLIRNEELILMYAEANITTNPTATENAINTIRTTHGLPVYSGGTDAASLLDEVARQRRYSLFGEGHRWVDARRLGFLNTLPIDRPDDDVFDQMPLPDDEVN